MHPGIGHVPALWQCRKRTLDESVPRQLHHRARLRHDAGHGHERGAHPLPVQFDRGRIQPLQPAQRRLAISGLGD